MAEITVNGKTYTISDADLVIVLSLLRQLGVVPSTQVGPSEHKANEVSNGI